jgi:HlyD family secretion protein
MGRVPANRRTIAGGLLVLIVLAAAGAVQLRRHRAPAVPVQEITRGIFVDHLQLRGEFKPRRSITVTAPSQGGDLLILQLVKNGTVVKKGDFIAQFDGATLQRTLDQRRSELNQAEAEVSRGLAQARIREEQDTTELMKARYDLDRARLDVGTEDLISRVDAEKFKLAVADAEQRVKESEQKLASDRAIGAADATSARQKAEKARFDVEQAERNLASLGIKAPAEGLVTLLPNYRASTPFGAVAEFKAGDRAWAGAAIAELPDLASIHVIARIDESDRSRLRAGLPVSVRVDALPELDLTGQVAEISTLARPDFAEWPPTRNFDLVVALARNDPRLRGGMSAAIRVAVDQVPDAILAPVRGIFEKSGRTVAYVLNGSSFDERPIDVLRRGREQASVRGVNPGDRIALQDPTVEPGGAKAGKP